MYTRLVNTIVNIFWIEPNYLYFIIAVNSLCRLKKKKKKFINYYETL